ncbi:hypothetical protein F0562_027891 [Nyssa sinensis]|uniref:Uncharacterized protein n=1 Tax=Nyssa sinensis TaxID=561372 RepID=A0A5J5B7F6_9ASTE|nr:hypothetical protein F0562_027891 [Nyssa sinensis]
MAAMEDVVVEGEVLGWRMGSKTKNYPLALLIKLFFPNYEVHVSNSKGFSVATKGGAAPIICGNSELPIKATHGVSTLDKARIQGSDGRSSHGIKEGRNSEYAAHSSLAFCGNGVLPIKVKNGEYPLGNNGIHGGDGRPSQGMQKGDSDVATPLVRLAMCAKEEMSFKVKNGQNP